MWRNIRGLQTALCAAPIKILDKFIEAAEGLYIRIH